MSDVLTNSTATEQERQRQLAELEADRGPNWMQEYQPGSFGCHELLDRASLLGDLVELQLLSHPACVANPQWYELAMQAVTALRDLYQQVGSEHV